MYSDPDPRQTKWTAELFPDGRVRFTDLVRPFPSRREFYIPQKRALLNATAELRTKMAIAFATTNIERQLGRLHRELEAIWRSDRPPHTRRALIFALWDECVESQSANPDKIEGQSEVDALRDAAGARARAEIIAFIRAKIPVDSADRYTEAELRSLNAARVSKERFAPYAA